MRLSRGFVVLRLQYGGVHFIVLNISEPLRSVKLDLVRSVVLEGVLEVVFQSGCELVI